MSQNNRISMWALITATAVFASVFLSACKNTDVHSSSLSGSSIIQSNNESSSGLLSSEKDQISDIPDSSWQEPSYSDLETSSPPPAVSSNKDVSSSKTSSRNTSSSSAQSKPAGYTGEITVKTTQAPGTTVYGENGVTIDASNTSQGYVMIKCVGASKRVKVQIYTDSSVTNTDDLNIKGEYEAFPLTMGNGTYHVWVGENISGTKYETLCNVSFSVTLQNEQSPFLYPNHRIRFDASSTTVKKSYDLCVGAESELEKVQAIYSFITKNITYDTAKAATVTSTYIPDSDAVLKAKKGICYDYAVMMAVMLRAQNIPTKLIIGNVAPNNLRHAWNMVYLKQTGWIALGVYFENGKWKRMDPTFAAAGESMEKFIGNGTNYTQLWEY